MDRKGSDSSTASAKRDHFKYAHRNSDPDRRESSVSSSYGGGPADSFSQLTEMSILDVYKEKLEKRKRKYCAGCLHLSGQSWVFLISALLQAVLITGVQIAIAILGQFRDSHIEEYVECLEESLRTQFDANITIADNATFPSFGEDKEVYIYFFIALVLYNFGLCIYALRFQNIVEVYTFMAINILAMAYASLQVYQFRGFGAECETITLVGYLALVNALLLLVFTLWFGVLSLFIYVEFGWKTYKLVHCNPALRYYYRVYQVFLSVVKLLILFTLIFFVAQCILILTPTNNEFPITVIGSVALVVLTYPIVLIIVRRESHIGSVLLVILVFLAMAYYVFKIARYATRSCPLCREQVATTEAARSLITTQLQFQLFGSGAEFPGNETITLSFLDREENFENLIMLGVINLMIAILAFLVYVHYWKNFGHGLVGYFRTEPPICPCCPSCSRGGAEGSDDTDHGSTHLRLRLWSAGHKSRKSTKKENRDSALEETFSNTTEEPHFNPAYSNTTTLPTDSFTYVQRNPHALRALGSVENGSRNGYHDKQGSSSFDEDKGGRPRNHPEASIVSQSLPLASILEEQ